ncbi:MAG: hypothetical protein ACOCRX_01140 [Candidatus Woesearchaeota archaeon]
MLYKKKLKEENTEKIAQNYAIAKVNDYQINEDNFNKFISDKKGLESFTNNFLYELIKNKDSKKINDYLDKSSNLVDYVNKVIDIDGNIDEYDFRTFYDVSKDKVSEESNYSGNLIKKYGKIALGLGDNKNKLDIISNDEDSLEVILNSAISGDKLNIDIPIIQNNFERDIKILGKFAMNNGFYNISMDAYEQLNDLKSAKKVVKSSVNQYLKKKKSKKAKEIAFETIDRYYELLKRDNSINKESFDFFEYTSKLGDGGMKKLDTILGEMFNDSKISDKQKVKAIHKYAEVCYTDDEIDTSKYLSKANNWLMTAHNLLKSNKKSNSILLKIKNKLDHVRSYFKTDKNI